jgi:hypothetical protein
VRRISRKAVLALALLAAAALCAPSIEGKSPSPAWGKPAPGAQPLSVDLALAQELIPDTSVTGTLGAQSPRYFKVFANRSISTPETLTVTLEATGSLFGAGSLTVFDPEQVLLDEVFTRNPTDINVSRFVVSETGYYLLQLLSAATYSWAVTVNWTSGSPAPTDNDNDLGNATALALPSGTVGGSVTEVTDLGDLYSVNLTAGAAASDALLINLTSPNTADLDVYIYHLEGGLAVFDGSSTSPFGTEYAAALAGSTTTYFVRVMSYAGSSTYSMAWAVLAVFADDNGVASKATPAADGSYLNNLSRWDTHDLFSFDVPANTTINISTHTVGFNAALWAPDLQVVFWNETFTRVSWSFTFDPDERINVEVAQAGRYYLEIFAADASYYLTTNLSFDYLLNISIDPPPALGDPLWNLSVPEDTPAAVDLRAVIPPDPLGEGLTYSVQVEAGQVVASLGGDGHTLTVQPAPDWSGPATVRVVATDRWRSEPIDLPFSFTAVNDPPRLAPGASLFAFDEDTTATISLSLTVTDPEGDPWVLVSASAQAPLAAALRTGFVDLSAPADVNGNFSLTLVVRDSLGSAANLTIAVRVRALNDAPRFVGPVGPFELLEDSTAAEATFPLALTAVDPDGDPITFSLTAPSTVASIVVAGNLSIYPARDFFGDVSATLTASDGTASVTLPVTIRVLPVDDAPSIRAPPSQLVGREDQVFTYSAEATDIDTPAFALLYSFSLDGAGASPLSANRTFSYRFTFEDAGFHVLAVTVSDGNYSASAQVPIFVSDTNRAPLASILAPRGEQFKAGALVTFSGRAIDPDGTTVNITWIVDGTQASSLPSFSLDNLGPGKHTVELRVSDGELISTDASTFDVQGGLPGFGVEAALLALAAGALFAIERRRR